MLKLLPWSLPLEIIASLFHSVAIVSTVFRLIYRWWLARFWWDDGWAAFALALEVCCLVVTWLDKPAAEMTPTIDLIVDWIVAFAFLSIVWFCRISILLSVVRVTNPSQLLRRITFFIACSFFIMCVALIGQKIPICIKDDCRIAASVGLSQLITDVISDSVLVFLPIYLLKRTKINDRQRILIYSVFSASLLITAVTIFHSVALITVKSSGIIVIGHIKAALSLIVCNLLVIVAFFCRISRRGKGIDIEVVDEAISFTEVDLDIGFTESGADRATGTVSRFSAAVERSHPTIRSSVIEQVVEAT